MYIHIYIYVYVYIYIYILSLLLHVKECVAAVARKSYGWIRRWGWLGNGVETLGDRQRQ